MVGIRKNIAGGLIIFVLFFFISDFSYGEDKVDSKNKEVNYTREFGFLTGWGSGELKRQDDYNLIPLYLQFGFDFKPILNKINIRPQGIINFILEPFLNTIISPDSNIEVGNNFILRYRHPIIGKFHLYLEAGLGLMYATQHTTEQSTQFNFSEQAGGGISYFFSKNKAINLGYRYRHFSNADIDFPNGGVDVEFLLCGISILY